MTVLPRASVPSMTSCAKHIFSDDIITINASTLIVWNYWNVCLVQKIRSSVIWVLSFSPSSHGAKFIKGDRLNKFKRHRAYYKKNLPCVTDRQLLRFFWKASEANKMWSLNAVWQSEIFYKVHVIKENVKMLTSTWQYRYRQFSYCTLGV